MRTRLAAVAFAAALALPLGGTSHAGCVEDWIGEDQFVPPGIGPAALFFVGEVTDLAECIV